MIARGNISKTALFLAMAFAIVFAVSSTAVLAEQSEAPLYNENSESIEISAKALVDHSCDESEWHFVITDIKNELTPPESIYVTWANASETSIVLDTVTGHVAHYRTTDNLDSIVTLATANISGEWDGQFNLSHGPCQQEEPEEVLGWIKICKVILDEHGTIVDGSTHPGIFHISGLEFGNPTGVLETTTFTTALDLNRDLLGNDSVNDAQCKVFNDLALGDYYYSEEEIEGDGWMTPRYNDVLNPTTSHLGDFSPYSGELFNEDLSDDGDRNFVSDGHIVLTEEQPNRILTVLNQFEAIELPYAPYCGDADVNQSWEQCDGGNQCTAQCQFTDTNQCTDLVLARVNIGAVENEGGGDSTSDIFLGGAANRIPQGTWFKLHENGSFITDGDMTNEGYEDVPGLAVERREGEVRVTLHGSNSQDEGKVKEHIDGDIEFWNVTPQTQESDTSGNNKLEKGFDGALGFTAGNDEVWFDGGYPEKSFFWLTVTTADDGFFTSYGDAPMCESDEQNDEEPPLDDTPPGGGGGGNDDEDDDPPLPYAPICGDGDVNQSWEQCDGGNQCTAQCQFTDTNQCTDLVLARVHTFESENHGNGDVTSDVFVGSQSNRLPAATWFPLFFAGEHFLDNDIVTYEDVPGLAVQRGLGEVRVLLHGSHGFDGSKEHINGKVEFWNTTVTGQSNDSSEGNSLENYNNFIRDNLPQEDEIWQNEGEDTKSYFWMTVTTGDDAFFTQFADAPICLENQAPTITLIGNNPIILHLGDTFIDPGAFADDQEDGDITGDIVVSGDTVDTNDAGSYRIFYNVQDSEGLPAEEVRRDVVVRRIGTPNPVCSDGLDNDNDGVLDSDDPACHIDNDPENPESYDPNNDSENSKPSITLVGDNPLILNFGDTYLEPGATANDPEDGDITADIVEGGDTIDTSVIGTSTRTYNVTDSDGLAADEVTRIVVVLDPETPTECSDQIDNDGDSLIDNDDPACHTDNDPENPESYDPTIDSETDSVVENSKPVITLIGDALVEVTLGGTFTDLGATATDTEDGDLTGDIVVGGDTVDINTLGTYVITFNVEDSEGLAADEVARTVRVIAAPTTPPGGGGGGGGSNPPSSGSGGGTPVLHPLKVSNEQIQVIAEGTALITWQTNKPATSRVVYDDDSHALPVEVLNFGTGSHDLGYEFSTTEVADLVTNHSVIVTNVNLEDRFFFRPVSTDGTRAIGIELNAALGVVSAGGACNQYLFDFIQVGVANNTQEVIKLQRFLNEFEGVNIEVSGVYNQATIAAVNKFQTKYADEVLVPWGIETPTSYVYLTTRKKVNEIYCNNQLAFPLTPEQLSEVNKFRALLDELRGTGSPLPPITGVVGQGSTGGSNLAQTSNGDALGESNETDGLAGAIESTDGDGVIRRTIRGIGKFFRNLFGRGRTSAPDPGDKVEVNVMIEEDTDIE